MGIEAFHNMKQSCIVSFSCCCNNKFSNLYLFKLYIWMILQLYVCVCETFYLNLLLNPIFQ
jgi:hypothetical protein